ncbi:unnamed protein product [Protopolystoma xenopodis]|uniref:Uncharacterized protein n=1 Tax=Protopolystoma xenopodis TaxID=117903 RepID=A0A3S5A051_9PLAT|nr:unnamed protein product [Protopolystoma xenopodis]
MTGQHSSSLGLVYRAVTHLNKPEDSANRHLAHGRATIQSNKLRADPLTSTAVVSLAASVDSGSTPGDIGQVQSLRDRNHHLLPQQQQRQYQVKYPAHTYSTSVSGSPHILPHSQCQYQQLHQPQPARYLTGIASSSPLPSLSALPMAGISGNTSSSGLGYSLLTGPEHTTSTTISSLSVTAANTTTTTTMLMRMSTPPPSSASSSHLRSAPIPSLPMQLTPGSVLRRGQVALQANSYVSPMTTTTVTSGSNFLSSPSSHSLSHSIRETDCGGLYNGFASAGIGLDGR